MKVIVDLLLQAKHWQMFLLLNAAPTVVAFAAIGIIPEKVHPWHDLGTGDLFLFVWTLLQLFCFLAWLGSMGLFFRSIVIPTLGMEPTDTLFFKIALVYPAVYFPIFFLCWSPYRGIPAMVIPLHVACMVCLFYLLYFVSKNLVLAETAKPSSFYEYAGAFFLLWFFPLGVWFIQPKVNRLYAERCRQAWPLTAPTA